MQLCTLAWLGLVPDDVTAAPPAAVGRLADQLHLDAGVLAGYGEWEQTRTDHLRLLLQYSGWRLPRSLEHKELEEFLLARAMEHDSPSLLWTVAAASRSAPAGTLLLLHQLVRLAQTIAAANEAGGRLAQAQAATRAATVARAAATEMDKPMYGPNSQTGLLYNPNTATRGSETAAQAQQRQQQARDQQRRRDTDRGAER